MSTIMQITNIRFHFRPNMKSQDVMNDQMIQTNNEVKRFDGDRPEREPLNGKIVVEGINKYGEYVGPFLVKMVHAKNRLIDVDSNQCSNLMVDNKHMQTLYLIEEQLDPNHR